MAARKKYSPLNVPSPVAKFMGRRRLVSDAIISKLRLQNQAANLAGSSVSSRVITSQIEMERRLELGPDANLDALTPLSRTIAFRYVAKIAPEAIRNPDIQNQRRLDAKNDIFNQISLAAVVSAILAPVDVGAKSVYKQSNIHCVDAMSILLFDRLHDTVRVGSSVRKEMKSKSRSISVTKNQPQCRTVKCYFDTSADGLLNVAIISIADRLFSEKRKWFRLDSGSNDYALWVLLISKTTKNKNNISEKENKSPNIDESNQSSTSNEELNENESEGEEEDAVINGLLKNKNYKETSTITDTVIMTEMLEYVILPYLVQKRKVSMYRTSAEFTVPSSRNLLSQTCNTTTYDQCEPHSSTESSSSSNESSSSSTSSSSPNIPSVESDLSRIPPPILVYLDGDYPQTMALVNGVLNIFEDDLVSVLKCPGGTSGICQPNDVMKSHMILRQSTTTGLYWEVFEKGVYELPDYWEDCLLPYFRQSGVSAASQNTYGYFFSTLSGLISKSFTVNIVKRGNSISILFIFYKLLFNTMFFFTFFYTLLRLRVSGIIPIQPPNNFPARDKLGKDTRGGCPTADRHDTYISC